MPDAYKTRSFGHDVWRMFRSIRTWALIIAGVLFSPLWFSLLALGFLWAEQHVLTRGFDAEDWACAFANSHERFRMVEDLIEDDQLVGHSREAIVARLGDPSGQLQPTCDCDPQQLARMEDYRYFETTDAGSVEVMRFYLGQFILGDDYFLRLRLGADARVVAVVFDSH